MVKNDKTVTGAACDPLKSLFRVHIRDDSVDHHHVNAVCNQTQEFVDAPNSINFITHTATESVFKPAREPSAKLLPVQDSIPPMTQKEEGQDQLTAASPSTKDHKAPRKQELCAGERHDGTPVTTPRRCEKKQSTYQLGNVVMSTGMQQAIVRSVMSRQQTSDGLEEPPVGPVVSPSLVPPGVTPQHHVSPSQPPPLATQSADGVNGFIPKVTQNDEFQPVPTCMHLPESLSTLPVAGKWQCLRRIGSGSFGETYFAKHIETGARVAVKVESLKSRHPQLLHEAKILRALQHHAGIPKVYYFGTHAHEFAVMVMELLGPTLEEVFLRWSGRSFTPAVVAMIGIQMLKRLESLHAEGFIHRDVKPDNFLVGLGENCGQVYIIDFGLAKRYRDPRTKAHIPYSERRSLTGTARYVSVNAHLGIEPSRRDDLESAGYIMVYFLRGGQLPWQGLKALTKQDKYAKIMHKKMTTPLESLTAGLPLELYTYLSYCRRLGFNQDPDYQLLKRLMLAVVLQDSSDLRSDVHSPPGQLAKEVLTPVQQNVGIRSRETETADTVQQPVQPSGECAVDNHPAELGQVMPYAERMVRFQSGLEKTFYGTDQELLRNAPLNQHEDPLCLQQHLKGSQGRANSGAVDAAQEHLLINAKRGRRPLYKTRRQRQLFCMTCARRNPSTSE